MSKCVPTLPVKLDFVSTKSIFFLRKLTTTKFITDLIHRSIWIIFKLLLLLLASNSNPFHLWISFLYCIIIVLNIWGSYSISTSIVSSRKYTMLVSHKTGFCVAWSVLPFSHANQILMDSSRCDPVSGALQSWQTRHIRLLTQSESSRWLCFDHLSPSYSRSCWDLQI